MPSPDLADDDAKGAATTPPVIRIAIARWARFQMPWRRTRGGRWSGAML
jgi:hypothetical protein